MKRLTLKRLVAVPWNHGYLYEIEEDKIEGESIEELREEIRLIIKTDRAVLGIETLKVNLSFKQQHGGPKGWSATVFRCGGADQNSRL